MFKKFLSIGLSLILVFGLMSVNVLAEEYLPKIVSTSRNGNSVTLYGEISNANINDIVEFGIEVYPIIGSGSVATHIGTGTAVSFEATFTNLASGEYKAYAYCKNRQGVKTTSSTPYSLDTRGQDQSIVVKTLSATGSGTNSVDVVARLESTSGRSIRAYGIAYSKNSDFSNVKEKNSEFYVGVDKTVTISDLEANQTYYFKSFITTFDGIYYYGDVKSAIVSSNSSQPQIITDSVTSNNTNYADVVIEVKSKGSYNVTEKGVVYSTSNSNPTLNDQIKIADYNSSDRTTVTLTSLNTGTRYYISSYMKLSNGTTYFGNVREFTAGQSSSNANPNVITDTISTTSATSADVVVKVDSLGSLTIAERGVVYSDFRQDPKADVVYSDVVIKKSDASFSTQSVTVPISGLTQNRAYYVRAYMKMTNGTFYYGAVKTYIAGSQTTSAIVNTDSITEINATGASVTLEIKNTGSTTITEKGVVYSNTNSNPSLDGTDVKFKTTTSASDKPVVVLSDLVTNKEYFVKAYVKNSSGTYYGDVKKFTTKNEIGVETTEIKDVKSNSAVAFGKISDLQGANLIEKGFAYSKTEKYPTVADYKYGTTASAVGVYSIEIPSLDTDSTYYVRAYAKTGNSVSYGLPLTFKTGANSTTVTIQFKDFDFKDVKKQEIISKPGAVLSSKDLQLPDGYVLVLPTWSYAVNNTETVVVYVKPKEAPKPTESEFMPGVSNYRFEPTRNATRAEVAEILYNLSANKTSGVPLTFSDVSASHPKKEAIDFVTSKGYFVGDGNGRFRPNDPIRRAEMCVILTKFYNYPSSSTNLTFKDTKKGEWYYAFVASTVDKGVFRGYPDGTFKPMNNISRAEVVVVFSFSENRSLQPLGTTQFTDVPNTKATEWYYKAVMNASVPRP